MKNKIYRYVLCILVFPIKVLHAVIPEDLNAIQMTDNLYITAPGDYRVTETHIDIARDSFRHVFFPYKKDEKKFIQIGNRTKQYKSFEKFFKELKKIDEFKQIKEFQEATELVKAPNNCPGEAIEVDPMENALNEITLINLNRKISAPIIELIREFFQFQNGAARLVIKKGRKMTTLAIYTQREGGKFEYYKDTSFKNLKPDDFSKLKNALFFKNIKYENL